MISYDARQEILSWGQLPRSLLEALTVVPGRRLEVLEGFDNRWIPFGVFDTLTLNVNASFLSPITVSYFLFFERL